MSILQTVAIAGAISFGALSVHAQNDSPEAEPSKPDLQVERLLNWLPADTETLIVAQGPWTVQDLEEEMMNLDPEEMDAAEMQALTRAMFSLLPSSFVLGAEIPAATEELKGKRVLLAIEGSRAFVAPSGMGGGTFEGCQLLVLEPDAVEAIGRIMERCEESATRTFEHAGVTAFAIEQETEDDATTLFFCRPEEAMLICATDEAFLKETLDRRKQEKPDERALPDSLPEWKHVNRRAAVWGLRHYREEPGKDDQSSPRHSQPMIPLRDAQSVGFTFAFEPEGEVMATVVHITPAENAAEMCKRAWSVINPAVEVKTEQVGPDAVRIAIPATDPYSTVNCFAMVAAYFGHVVNF